jgi:hypothetical protein
MRFIKQPTFWQKMSPPMALKGINKWMYWLLQSATARALWIALTAYIAMAMVMNWGAQRMNSLAGTRVDVLDLQPGYTPA